MSISSAVVNQFFQLLTKRRFAEAERKYERLSRGEQKNEWNKGYLQALNGVLIGQKSDDQYLFVSNINFSDKTELRKHRREFLKYAKSSLRADYDRGFFSAWADYMRFLSKIKRVKSTK